MKNKDKWKQTILAIDKKGNLIPDKQSAKGGSYVSITISCLIRNKIGKKYFKGKLLDLGCGNVPYYAWYKDSVDENICVDWANTLHKNEFLDVVADINEDLPFKEGEFDSILCSAVMEHIYDPFHLFKECHRILKKGGYFTINTVLSYCEHEIPYDYLRHTQYFLKRIAKETGFEIVEFETNGDGLCVMADIAAKIHALKPKNLLFTVLNSVMRFLFNWFYIKKKKRILANYPIGYIVVAKKL